MFMKLLASCFGGSNHESHLAEVLQPTSVSILSASCCDASGLPKEQELKRNVAEAMQRLAHVEPVCIETITAAQSGIRSLAGKLDARQQRLVDTVVHLFQTQGLSVFPMLVVDGRLAYYGGVPSVDMIVDKLRNRSHRTVSQANAGSNP